MKLRDPPSSVKTPKASEGTGRKPWGKPGRGRRSPRWSDWVWQKPRAWAAMEESPVPLPSAPGRSLGERWSRRRGTELGRAGPGAPPAAP